MSCAKDESLDQVLDEVLLPADTVGRFQFTLEVFGVLCFRSLSTENGWLLLGLSTQSRQNT